MLFPCAVLPIIRLLFPEGELVAVVIPEHRFPSPIPLSTLLSAVLKPRMFDEAATLIPFIPLSSARLPSIVLDPAKETIPDWLLFENWLNATRVRPDFSSIKMPLPFPSALFLTTTVWDAV